MICETCASPSEVHITRQQLPVNQPCERLQSIPQVAIIIIIIAGDKRSLENESPGCCYEINARHVIIQPV